MVALHTGVGRSPPPMFVVVVVVVVCLFVCFCCVNSENTPNDHAILHSKQWLNGKRQYKKCMIF